MLLESTKNNKQNRQLSLLKNNLWGSILVQINLLVRHWCATSTIVVINCCLLVIPFALLIYNYVQFLTTFCSSALHSSDCAIIMSFPLSQQHLVWWQDEGGGQDDSVNPAAPRGSIGRYRFLKPSSIVAIFVLLNFFGNLPTTLADIRISSAIISPPQMDEDSSLSFAGGDDAKFGSTKDETASVIVDSLVTQQQYCMISPQNPLLVPMKQTVDVIILILSRLQNSLHLLGTIIFRRTIKWRVKDYYMAKGKRNILRLIMPLQTM